jgi:hypothetical protein
VENIMREGQNVVYINKSSGIHSLGQTRKDIWKVREYFASSDQLQVESLSKPGKIFNSNAENFYTVESLLREGKFKKEFFIEKAYHKANSQLYGESWESYCNDKEASSDDKIKFTESKMSNTNMVKRTVDSNVDAAKVAAKITAGKTLNGLVATQLRDRKILPVMVRGYADTAFGAVVIANIADFAVKQFAANNRKAVIATDAMMQAAMVELMEEFDFEGMINDLLSNVNLEAVVEE